MAKIPNIGRVNPDMPYGAVMGASGLLRGAAGVLMPGAMIFSGTMLGAFAASNLISAFEITKQREDQRDFTREQNIYYAQQEGARNAREDYEWNRDQAVMQNNAALYIKQREIDEIAKLVGPQDTIEEIDYILLRIEQSMTPQNNNDIIQMGDDLLYEGYEDIINDYPDDQEINESLDDW